MDRIKQIKKLRDQGKSYTEIGKILGVSRQRAHQILPGYCNPVLRHLELEEKEKALEMYRRYLKKKEERHKFMSSPEGFKKIIEEKNRKARHKYWRLLGDRKYEKGRIKKKTLR